MIYLKINSMKGSVAAKNYQSAIEVCNYTFNSKRSLNNKSGLVANRSAGLVHSDDLTLVKPMDNATADLLKYHYDAKVIPEISFHHVSTGISQQSFISLASSEK